MAKLDLGSGPRDYWISEDPEWIHLDCEPYEGVVRWCYPDPIPVENHSVEEVYIGELLVELSVEDHISLSKELARVMKPEGEIKVHCYGGSLSNPDFFVTLREHGWFITEEKLINFWNENFTYLIKVKKEVI